MNRQTYQRVIRSIRDNGLRYTTQHAIDTNDTDAILICDDVANILKQTDWLALRVKFARREKSAVAFKLTTHLLDHHTHVWVERIH
jgi:hypothetical protein